MNVEYSGWRKSPSPRPSPHRMGRGWPIGRVRGLSFRQLFENCSTTGAVKSVLVLGRSLGLGAWMLELLTARQLCSVLGNRRRCVQDLPMSERVLAQIMQLLVTPGLAELGPGPRAGVLSESSLNTKLDSSLGETRLAPVRQELVRSLVLLWHDHLDASHNISQGIENADGSFVHAIMHRREPDASNSKYWWRRVGQHPAFPGIASRVGEFLARSRRREEADPGKSGQISLVTSAAAAADLMKRLLSGGKWDAAAFVDACDTETDEAIIPTLREIQRIESEVLLEFFCHE